MSQAAPQAGAPAAVPATESEPRLDSQAAPDIDVRGAHKSFGDKHVLRGLDLQVRQGETFAIIGRSGCGKSVTLKLVIGLLRPDRGEVYVFGRDVNRIPRRELLELRLRVGMVFQLSALLNSLTVEENVLLGLTERGGKGPEELRRLAREKLALVGMEGSEKLLPEELSGGMKKRVAVARTLAMSPDIILFDEPTTGLDPLMSDNVDSLIHDLKRKVRCTNVVVTHDMISAFRVADRVGMFHEGRIIEVGSPRQILESKNPVVQEFIDRHVHWRA
jgi:phospholipid/cholesterol/gamma-HCH transport system ATP-binding protein